MEPSATPASPTIDGRRQVLGASVWITNSRAARCSTAYVGQTIRPILLVSTTRTVPVESKNYNEIELGVNVALMITGMYRTRPATFDLFFFVQFAKCRGEECVQGIAQKRQQARLWRALGRWPLGVCSESPPTNRLS
jgi:hypothetical protein